MQYKCWPKCPLIGYRKTVQLYSKLKLLSDLLNNNEHLGLYIICYYTAAGHDSTIVLYGGQTFLLLLIDGTANKALINDTCSKTAAYWRNTSHRRSSPALIKSILSGTTMIISDKMEKAIKGLTYSSSNLPFFPQKCETVLILPVLVINSKMDGMLVQLRIWNTHSKVCSRDCLTEFMFMTFLCAWLEICWIYADKLIKTIYHHIMVKELRITIVVQVYEM